MISFIRCLFLGVWLSVIAVQEVDSFSSISSHMNFFPSPLERDDTIATSSISLRIRSTKESDVRRGISDVWAWAIVDPKGKFERTTQLGFRRHLDFLKSKKCVEDMLLARLNAIRAAERTMEECIVQYEENKLSEADKLRYLWSNERFRSSMERAAKLSNEPHRWNSYNFACAPRTAEYLQHKMLTAEDTNTGELLGFCEVAMLLDPTHIVGSSEEHVRPTMVNLVVSPKFRRLGVASRLIKSAKKYVEREWDADELNLYVDEDNDAAISLYTRQGFQKTSTAQHPEYRCRQLYMTLSLGAATKQNWQTLTEVLQLSS